jgi:predicted phosphodiesterase
MKFLKYDLTNVAVIGDIHSSLDNLQNILKLIEVDKRKKLITLGDIWDRGNEPNEVIDILYDLYTCGKLIPIIGNHDVKHIRHFTENKNYNLGTQQEATLNKLTKESIDKFVEIYREDIVCIYDPIMKIFLSHGPGGRPQNILYKNYENERIIIGGQPNVTFEEFILKDNHNVAKKHISTLLYGITNGDKTMDGFPVRLPIIKDINDNLEGWVYCYGHIHSSNFYPEKNKSCICLDFCSPTGKIGAAIINSKDDINLLV